MTKYKAHDHIGDEHSGITPTNTLVFMIIIAYTAVELYFFLSHRGFLNMWAGKLTIHGLVALSLIGLIIYLWKRRKVDSRYLSVFGLYANHVLDHLEL